MEALEGDEDDPVRNNQPVTQQPHHFPPERTLMSATDTRGNITYANAAFVDTCGFEYSELLGQPHNVVRHPDMPQEAFADMWATMQAGYSWTGVVKNRRKNGDHYWVRANATPIERDDGTIGYMSVRTAPTPQEVQAADSLYRLFRESRKPGLAFRRGIVVRTGAWAWRSMYRALPGFAVRYARRSTTGDRW